MDRDEGILLFRRLGVDVDALSEAEFKAAYHRLAWRYHPDLSRRGCELMANINAARTEILKGRKPRR
jgi:DnaJ-class molecular chaperone